MPTKLKIIYVVGTGRCGSTLVGRILGEASGFTHVGELRYLWNRGIQGAGPCSCGRNIPDCDYWHSVLHTAFPSNADIDPQFMHQIVLGARKRHVLDLLWPYGRDHLRKIWATLIEQSVKLYFGIAYVSQGRVLVDISKHVTYGLMLSLMPDTDVYFVHIVRNPGAVANSWLNRRERNSGRRGTKYFGRHGYLDSCIGWLQQNLLAEILGWFHKRNYIRIRYEDLVADGESVVQLIFKLAQEQPQKLFVEQNIFRSLPAHAALGNRSIKETDNVKLRLDNEWLHLMPWYDRLLVLILTWPLALPYGYVLQHPTK